MRPGASSERAVILAPTGRDAAVAAALIKEAGYYANVCADLAALMHEIEGGAGLAVIADEAIKTADLRGLMRWLNDQPSWSDFPIVLLTHQGGGPERNPDAVRLGQVLGNVTFIERPFHPTTLVSVVGSAVRGRRRQYQTRAILEDLTESEGLLQTALNAGHLGALELHLPELELEASDTCKAFFGRKPGEPFSYQDLLAAVHPDDRATAPGGAGPDHQDRQGLQHRIPQYLARRIAALGRRPRPRGAPARRQHQIAGRRFVRHHRAQGRRNRARESAGATGGRAHRAGGTDGDAGAARRAAHRRSDEGSRRARKGPGAIAPGAEDGDHRPAHRRRRARFQQSPDGGDGQSRSVAQAHSRRSAAAPADRRRVAGRRARRVADAAAAGVRAAAGSARGAGRSARA